MFQLSIQAVGAEQKRIAEADVEDDHIEIQLALATDRASDHVGLARLRGSDRDHAVVEEIGDRVVVARDLRQHTVPQSIQATIAGPQRDADLIARQQRHDGAADGAAVAVVHAVIAQSDD